MSEEKLTSVLLVTRSQVWFSASVATETLGPFNAQTLEKFPMPTPNGINLRTWIGKGPCDCDIGASATVYFDHGEESYPIFTWPSFSPKGSTVYATPRMRKLIADEHSAIFVLEVATSIPVAPDLFEKVPELVSESENRFIMNCLTANRTAAHVLIGLYSLYQYPLVWSYMDERNQYVLVDAATMQVKPTFEPKQVDNWFPFRLDVCGKIGEDGLLRDSISQHFAEFSSLLAKEEFRQPFIMLKDSMCHTDIRTRFLMQFWIVEYFSHKYTEQLQPDRDIQIFVQDLEKVVNEKFSSMAEHFRSRKGELTRLTLLQKIKSCFQSMRIQYNEVLVRKAKAVRDSLSHASDVGEHELREMELYIRELVRHMIRRDLELQGIFLDGEKKPVDQLAEIVLRYPEPSIRQTASFGPLEAK